MHKSATKCNETLGKWCKNKHVASKIIDTLETYHSAANLDVLRAHHLHARQDRWSDVAQIPLRRPGPRSCELPAGELSSSQQVPGLYPVLLATPTIAKLVRPHKYCSGTQT
jgi:hypothetical protein